MRHELPGLLPALLASTTVAIAQTPTFVALPPAPSSTSAWAWDSDRGRITAVENTAPYLWDWDGTTWSPRTGVASGAAGSFAGYDPVRRVLLAGTGGTEWNGASWILRGGVPNGNYLGPLAFDVSRRRVVAPTSTGAIEWDGVQNHILTAANGPPVRAAGAFAFDPVHQRCVLYGGRVALGTAVFDDCWSWDGAAWTQLAANAPPGPRSSATLAEEPATGQMVLYGGGGTTTWRLGGSTWTQVATTRDPGERSGAHLVFDGQGLLLSGNDAFRGGELWRFQNHDWTELQNGAPMPRQSAALGYDPIRGEVVLHSGLGGPSSMSFFGDTWTFDGQWHQHRTAITPAASAGANFAWSAVDQALLLARDSETWLWNGAAWIQRTPAVTPPARDGAALLPDPLGGVFLFGGRSATYFGDQWRWDGTNWAQLNLPVAPSPRLPLAAFDPLRNVVVLASGIDGAQNLTDTWEWNGISWTQFGSTPFQMGTLDQRLVWNPATARVRAEVLGQFEWDGATWTTIVMATSVETGASYVADLARGHVLRAGSQGRGFAVLTANAATAVSYGNGCALGAAPGLLGLGRPTPGNAAFALAATTFAPGAPAFLALGLQMQNQPLGSGCSALVGTVLGVHFFVAAPSGQVELPFPLPNDLSLRGVSFAAQAAVIDPARSVFAGITTSAGLWTTIGD
jgi:hypothetical protein